ncbi:MAG: glycerol-3-phosphate acyltransferase [bacterium]
MIYLKTILAILGGYLLGSVLFAYVFVRLLTHKDIRALGDGNPGATNVFQSVSKPLGVAVAVADGLKAFVAMFWAQGWELPPVAVVLVGWAAILGHCFPIYHGFRGGRGTASTSGFIAFMAPWEFFVSLGVALLSMIAIRRKRQDVFPAIVVGLAIILSWIRRRSPLMALSFLAVGIGLGFRNIPGIVRLLSPSGGGREQRKLPSGEDDAETTYNNGPI